MKTIVLFGAGKSATVLIDYLKQLATDGFCHVIIVDAELQVLREKVGNTTFVSIEQVNITDELQRNNLIAKADVVISLMPPTLHYLIATSCIYLKKNLLTASYIDDATKALAPKIEAANILFLYEIGLDPGIDHMSAMQIIDTIEENGGKITSFISHCGGLIAPESDDNPWHYKISWNPKNIIMAGKAGAVYLEENIVTHKIYDILFKNCEQTHVMGLGKLAYYPNRDSLSYKNIYKLKNATTFIRTTLRHPDFIIGWAHIIDLKLTDEIPFYHTDHLTISQFFNIHLKRFDFHSIYNDSIDNNLLLKNQFYFLFNDDSTFINKGFCSAADVLQFIIEQKLLLQTDDKDMIVMQHEIAYEMTKGNEQGTSDREQDIRDKQLSTNQKQLITSTLIVNGENNIATAMAKTVGLPLGIASKMIIEDKILLRGLKIPIYKEIYTPVLEELKNWGIAFKETITDL
jgi:saccharopine dehydrogenase (NADP+, L-glutamate forming)